LLLATAAFAIVGSDRNHQGTRNTLSILWTILIGFIAGVIAKFVTPGSTHEPQGFILTAALGIVGALVATSDPGAKVPRPSTTQSREDSCDDLVV
jgi:hypothetical protein